jgi:signal transduction histidine kinase
MISRAAEDGRELLRRLQVDERAPVARATLETSVAQIVREVAKLTRPLWERHADVRVQTLLDGAPMVRMPAEELREVLVNLLMNAIAAVTEAGTITIYGRAVGDRAMISVTDTGQGIARENHSAIFQPLMTTRVDGSGLGLSVSRALVESNGGTLIVESEPGQGATFTIALPLAVSWFLPVSIRLRRSLPCRLSNLDKHDRIAPCDAGGNEREQCRVRAHPYRGAWPPRAGRRALGHRNDRPHGR